MNAYPGFPPCLENEPSSRDRTHSKGNHTQQSYPGQSSTFLQLCRKRVLQTHSSVFIESALSPAKYAMFQLIGTYFLQICRCPRSPPSYANSAKIGAFGGIIVTIFYLFLVLTRSTSTKSHTDVVVDDPRDRRQSVMILLHEMLYSAVASAIGCMAYSRTGNYDVDLAVQIFVGWVGPVLFLLALFWSAGVVWSITYFHKKVVDWYTGY